MDFEVGKEQTFRIAKTPPRIAQQKTLRRLMRMQPHIQRGLSALSLRRRREDNRTYQRAGRQWTDRATMTRLTQVQPGESFTIFVSPHILPDLRSVEPFLTVE